MELFDTTQYVTAEPPDLEGYDPDWDKPSLTIVIPRTATPTPEPGSTIATRAGSAVVTRTEVLGIEPVIWANYGGAGVEQPHTIEDLLPFQVGDRVRVIRGCQQGLEGTVRAINPRLKHSIELEAGKGRWKPDMLERVETVSFQVGDVVEYRSGDQQRQGTIDRILGGGASIDEGHPYKSWVEFKYLKLVSRPSQLENNSPVLSSPEQPQQTEAEHFAETANQLVIDGYRDAHDRALGVLPQSFTHELVPPKADGKRKRRYSPKGKAVGWIEERKGNLKRKNPSVSYYYCWMDDGRKRSLYIPVRQLRRIQTMVDDRCSGDEILAAITKQSKSHPTETLNL